MSPEISRHVEIATAHLPIKAWVRGVPVEDVALAQLRNVAQLPIVHGWVAAMPDVHWGIGATVGSVIATREAIIPAAVGVDIGCGMIATQLSLGAHELRTVVTGAWDPIARELVMIESSAASPTSYRARLFPNGLILEGTLLRPTEPEGPLPFALARQ